MATLTVGQGQQYTTISAAVAASHDGDVVQVQAGTYVNDFATINTKITLEGVGGMVKMVATQPLPNDKGILVTNTDVTIDHFEFSGATGPSGNDAGVRYQGGALTITNSYFHDNQNGLLANPVAGGTITIRNSEFDHNGAGDGYTHNLYVGDIAKLTISDSYFHDAVVGHEIKSRAEVTEITNTRVFDNASDSSYSIDLPNGGQAVLSGNVIEQGAHAGNPNIVAFGEEGNVYDGSSLTLTGNTVINDLGSGALVWNASNSPATVSGTQVWGLADAQMVTGSGSVSGTSHLSAAPALDTSHPWSSDGTTPDPTPTPTPTPAPAPSPSPTPTAGDDMLTATAGSPTLDGGAGADTLAGGAFSAKLRGGDGADLISGGSLFDDLQGNAGADTERGGQGDDWVVGGKDGDLLYGDAGHDVVLGNMGADSVYGGADADIVRGGQGADLVVGGAGDDYLSGDRGSDTVTGGLGADRFHTWGDAGLDRVTDFHLAEGDRVQIDPGATYTVAQVDADTVISIAGGAQMVLVNVQASTLQGDWIIQA
jgi:Ca2+-binding RTX toxin-like protein